jgi:hypothetical protein
MTVENVECVTQINITMVSDGFNRGRMIKMPRNVRNFWIQLDVDGRKERIATGPRNKDGGFEMQILMREDGCISDKRVEIRGYVAHDTGKLVLIITSPSGAIDPINIITTER